MRTHLLAAMWGLGLVLAACLLTLALILLFHISSAIEAFGLCVWLWTLLLVLSLLVYHFRHPQKE